MSAFKGTPGPWAVNPVSAQVDAMPSLLPVCQLLWPTDQRSEAETEDNARLISAAPELLEALEQLIGPEDDPKAGWRGWTPSTEMFRCEFCGQEDLDCGRIQHDDRCPIKAARAAIAKATGEQP